jgi:hypothetical protein
MFCVAVYFPLGWLEQQPHLILGYDRSGDFPEYTAMQNITNTQYSLRRDLPLISP